IEDAAIAYLGIGSHFGSFRSQNAKGHLLGHVRDLGLDVRNANVRYYQTTRQLEYHTDSCDVVGLLCLKAAKRGGESRIVSSVTLFNEILRRRPDLLPELFHPFPTDRRGEVPRGMKPWFEVPVFNWYAGHLTTMYVGQYIRSAQTSFPDARRLTPGEREALDLLDALANEPGLNLQMTMVPGDMQFLHNHQILHSRTDFEDWPEPERKRHLLRLWIAPSAGRPLPPSFAPRYGSVVPGERGGIVTAETRLKFVLQPE
ncbi:MAG TPA: TauD/TfdA family dioxygenase, partial [Casimicrobiaceae bacterium]